MTRQRITPANVHERFPLPEPRRTPPPPKPARTFAPTDDAPDYAPQLTALRIQANEAARVFADEASRDWQERSAAKAKRISEQAARELMTVSRYGR